MQLAHQGLIRQKHYKKHKNLIGHMLKILRNAVCTDEKAPVGCSELAKGLSNQVLSKFKLESQIFIQNPSKLMIDQGLGYKGISGGKKIQVFPYSD